MSLNLNELEAAVGKMTPGPWCCDESLGNMPICEMCSGDEIYSISQPFGRHAGGDDARAIVALRNAAPALIAAAREREGLRAKLAETVNANTHAYAVRYAEQMMAQRDELAALLRECAENCHMPDERRKRIDAALAKVGP